MMCVLGIDAAPKGVAICRLLPGEPTATWWITLPALGSLERLRAPELRRAAGLAACERAGVIGIERPMSFGATRSITEQMLLIGGLVALLTSYTPPDAQTPTLYFLTSSSWWSKSGIGGRAERALKGGEKPKVRAHAYTLAPHLEELDVTQDECDAVCIAHAAASIHHAPRAAA
jgi:hypothetical protein